MADVALIVPQNERRVRALAEPGRSRTEHPTEQRRRFSVLPLPQIPTPIIPHKADWAGSVD